MRSGTELRPLGATPYGVAYDGANVWVVNFGGSSITKLARNTGAVLGTYSVGSGPEEVAFDGAYLWIVNVNDGTVSKL